MIGTREQIRVGAWWCMCCPEDLYQIADENDVATVLSLWDDEDGNMVHGVWDTEAQALYDMRDDVAALAEFERTKDEPRASGPFARILLRTPKVAP